MSKTVAWGGNPYASPNKKRKKTKTMAKKKGSKKSRNPIAAMMGSGIGKTVKEAAMLSLGRTVNSVIAQNLIPSAYRTGMMGNVAKGGLALALGFAFKRVSALRPYAEYVEVGGLSGAISDTVDPIVLPPTAFNLLGESRYFGELDTRVLTLAGVQPARVQQVPTAARPVLQGYDQRTLRTVGGGRTVGRRMGNRLPA